MTVRPIALALAALLAAAAGAVALPGPPPAPAWPAADARPLAACPLWWSPDAPFALYPHPAPAPGESRLADLSGAARLAAARAYVETGQPGRALAALDSVPDGSGARLYRLAALHAAGRHADLARALEALPGGGLPAGCGPLRDRWEGAAAAAAGRLAAMDRAFDRLATAVPELGAYVELWRLEAAAAAGAIERGEAAWARVGTSDLPEAPRLDGEASVARLYASAGRLADARTWTLRVAGRAAGPTRARLLLEAAALADRAGDRAAGDRIRRRVIDEVPASADVLVLDEAVRARLGIAPLEAARVLLSAGRADRAEPFATAVIESRAPEARRKEARLLRAGIRAARGDRAGAEDDFADFLATWPADARVPDVLYDRARLALDAGDGAVARQRFENLLARFPGHRRATAARYLAADSYQDDRRRDPAFADRAIEGFDAVWRGQPGSFFADRAYMRAAHLAWSLGRWPEAERRYAEYRGSESAREARYWLARTLEKRGQNARARELLGRLAAGDDYYALLARDRLAGRRSLVTLASAGYRPGPDDPYAGHGDALLAHPPGRRAAALLAFGEREWAEAELARAVVLTDRATRQAWAPALAAWGFPGLTLRIGVRLGGEDHPLAYPAGFAAAVDREAREHGLDAFYVLALIRQESLYRADVVSPADARGLMQILPRTGRALAASAGHEGFDEADLFRPAVNLHFGARYLEEQLARFDGFWPAVLAAYNGGPDAVAVWWDFPERTLDPELWIDRIPYKETRDYVKKIVAQRARYRVLHGGSAPAR